MTTMAIEELEANLRAVLERVRAGETVLISSGGEPIAEITPCDIADVIARAHPGVIRSTMHMRDIHIEPVPVPEGVDVVAMLLEDREDRDLLS